MSDGGNVAVLQNVVRERFATADLLMSFAASALDSSRSATVARPLPMVAEEARAAMSELAALSPATDLALCSARALELLSFLCFVDVVSLRKVAVSKWAAAAGCQAPHLPDAVFEVEYGVLRDEAVNALARQKHAEFVKAQQQRHPTITAYGGCFLFVLCSLLNSRGRYHGTDLCNLHNVLREGLKNDVKLAGRNGAVFGKGIYLAEELTVASNFLSFGRGRSGETLACMLECEVVVDPAQVWSERSSFFFFLSDCARRRCCGATSTCRAACRPST